MLRFKKKVWKREQLHLSRLKWSQRRLSEWNGKSANCLAKDDVIEWLDYEQNGKKRMDYSIDDYKTFHFLLSH